jgi:hypothetical protein
MPAYYVNPPTKCDICHKAIESEFVDGKTTLGPWANMCTTCFKAYGVGTGTGLGQIYVKEDDGQFRKVAG